MREERSLWQIKERDESDNQQLNNELSSKMKDAGSQLKNLEAVEEEEKKDLNHMLGELD